MRLTGRVEVPLALPGDHPMPPLAAWLPPQAQFLPLSAAPSQMPPSSEPMDISQVGGVDSSARVDSESGPMDLDDDVSVAGGVNGGGAGSLAAGACSRDGAEGERRPWPGPALEFTRGDHRVRPTPRVWGPILCPLRTRLVTVPVAHLRPFGAGGRGQGGDRAALARPQFVLFLSSD